MAQAIAGRANPGWDVAPGPFPQAGLRKSGGLSPASAWGALWRAANKRAAFLAAAGVVLLSAVWTGGCGQPQSTCDISSLSILRYRYLADPRDPQVHAVVEVKNTGPLTVERALLVVTGIGRNGEKRGESRVVLERLRPGERRTVTTQFTNRGRLATVEVGLEPAPEAERGK